MVERLNETGELKSLVQQLQVIEHRLSLTDYEIAGSCWNTEGLYEVWRLWYASMPSMWGEQEVWTETIQ